MKTPLLKLLPLVLVCLGAANGRAQFASSNFTLVGQSDPETTFNSENLKYSGCWGWYQESKQKEYGIACSHKGTYWIDMTVPSSPTVSAYRPGKLSGCTWREAKSYKNFLYVISDDNGANSFQIFDMQYLPDSVHKVYDGTDLFERGHTLWIDGDKLYIGSRTTNNTLFAMSMYSLANPVSPLLIRNIDDDYPFINYVHDMFVRRDTIYASCGFQGMYVFRYNGTTFTQIGSLTSYPFAGYNHSSQLTPDGKTLVFADEVPDGLPVKVADVTNLSNIQVLATVNQFPQTTPHNPFVPNNTQAFVSSYQDGLQLYDISTPSAPVLAGFFDTYPQGGGNINSYPFNDTYRGQWGCYPYLPSGNIFALDRFNGGFILSTHLYKGPYIQVTSNVPPAACAGSTLAATVQAPGATTITWFSPGAVISPTTGTSATIQFSAAGVYSVTVTASHSGSVTTSIRTITVTALASVVTATNPACVSCTNGKANVTPAGGLPPYSFTWMPSGGNNALATGLAAGCYTVTIRDSGGCEGSASRCLVASTANIDELTDNPLQVFPNPATGFISVVAPPGGTRYSVYNTLGSVVMSGDVHTGMNTLDVTALAKGLYVISVEANTGSRAARVIIE
jgi:choice-of-anchor B domain-containing protein